MDLDSAFKHIKKKVRTILKYIKSIFVIHLSSFSHCPICKDTRESDIQNDFSKWVRDRDCYLVLRNFMRENIKI